MAPKPKKKSIVADLPDDRKWILTLLAGFLDELNDNGKITDAQWTDIRRYLLEKSGGG